MHLTRHARTAAAVTAAVCAIALIATTAGGTAQAAPPAGPDSTAFRTAVTPAGVQEHLTAFQAIADRNGGHRAAATSGYDASVDYVVDRLEAAGYQPTIQRFAFPYFAENTPSQLAQLTPDSTTYADSEDFSVMSYSGSGVVSGPVVPVDTDFTATDASTSGCEAADFAGFPTAGGEIALLQRGTCTFEQKAANAQDAGAEAVLIFNRGTEGATDTIAGTLGRPFTLPVLGLSFETGVDLGSPAGTTARVVTDTTNETRNTSNVVAETPGGDRDNVVMAGAHLDSVEAGPGINDNGSGSAAILEIAEQLADVPVTNRVRFAWWGAEELGLLGAEHYVADLAANNPDELKKRLALYLNFDMVGSPNFGRFIYDGDNSTGEGAVGPRGSAQIETLFTQYFGNQGLYTEPTAFDGRSDYGPFIANGVPSGGLFTGAEEVKTADQASTQKFGGEEGVAFDHCYHAVCDDITNVNPTALDEMSDAAAHAVYVYSQTTDSLTGQKTRTAGESGAQKGHQAVR